VIKGYLSPLPARNYEVEPTGATAHNVIAGIAAYGPKGRSNFVYDPATGTLKVRPDRRLEIEKALLRETRRLKLRLYLHLATLQLRLFMAQLTELRIKCWRCVLQTLCLVIGFLDNC
jgi:hypothetical protein